METLFNLVWVAVCICGVAAWRPQFQRAGTDSSGLHPILGVTRTQSLLLLIFVVALLFPVISITDDLQIDLPVAEARLSSQEISQTLARQASAKPISHLSLGWLSFATLIAMALVVIWQLLEQTQLSLPNLRLVPIPRRRPPPSGSLVF